VDWYRAYKLTKTNMSTNCLFCKIVAGEIPATKIYEDEKSLAFLDIMPASYGHTLVIPKEHHANFDEVTPEVLCQTISCAQKVGRAVKSALDLEGYNVDIHNGEVAGQSVQHLHIHIIPRHKDDGLLLFPRSKYQDGEMEEIAGKIREQVKRQKAKVKI